MAAGGDAVRLVFAQLEHQQPTRFFVDTGSAVVGSSRAPRDVWSRRRTKADRRGWEEARAVDYSRGAVGVRQLQGCPGRKAVHSEAGFGLKLA